MISHQYKCIFIHIPRTGGTSIEMSITGNDWWFFNRGEKHITVRQARARYADYWKEYFKFTIVRNPYDQLVSHWLWRIKWFNANISFQEFLLPQNRIDPMCKQINAPLDMIYKFENIANAFQDIAERIQCPPISVHTHINDPHAPYKTYYYPECETINQRYHCDFEKFGYDMITKVPLV